MRPRGPGGPAGKFCACQRAGRRGKRPGMKTLCMAAVLAACLAGCVEREMKITSEPEGALVFVSDREVGRTPVTLPFTWYGDYDILLRLEGHKTLVTHAKISPPAYEIPPVDLFSAIAPWTYHDRRFLHFKLEKLPPPDDAALLERADKLRERTAEPVKVRQ